MEHRSNRSGGPPKQKIDSLGNLRRVLKYVSPYWQFKFVMGLILITVVLDVLTPDVIGVTIDMIGSLDFDNLPLLARRDLAACQAMIDACFASDDYKEGQTAFMEKRKPVFRGR